MSFVPTTQLGSHSLRLLCTQQQKKIHHCREVSKARGKKMGVAFFSFGPTGRKVHLPSIHASCPMQSELCSQVDLMDSSAATKKTMP